MSTTTQLFKRAISTEGDLTKQQISNILFVVKQLVGVILGVTIALSGVKGTLALLAYAGASFVVCYVYVMKFLQPEDQVIEPADLFKDHWMLGFFNFLLVWIFTYNLLNY